MSREITTHKPLKDIFEQMDPQVRERILQRMQERMERDICRPYILDLGREPLWVTLGRRGPLYDCF